MAKVFTGKLGLKPRSFRTAFSSPSAILIAPTSQGNERRNSRTISVFVRFVFLAWFSSFFASSSDTRKWICFSLIACTDVIHSL